MEELSIKVTIANRQFPLKIKQADEAKVRKAEALLNERITEYEQQYAVSDKIDLVSMCAMQLASELVNLTEDFNQNNSVVADSIAEIDKNVAAALKATSVH